MLKGKIVLIPFPFDDLSYYKVRPAVCLTNSIGLHQQLVLSFISSQLEYNLLQTDILIAKNHPEFSQTGLKKDSVLRLHRMLTVNINLIQRELGYLPNNLMQEVNNKLIKLFELKVIG